MFLTLSHCQKDELNQDVQKTIETVSFSEAIELINASNPLVLNRTSEEPFVTPNLENIYQEPLINSNALLTIIPARNKYEDVYAVSYLPK